MNCEDIAAKKLALLADISDDFSDDEIADNGFDFVNKIKLGLYGKHIKNNNYCIQRYVKGFDRVTKFIVTIEETLKSQAITEAEKFMMVSPLEFLLELSGMTATALLEADIPRSKKEIIHQMQEHATTEIAKMKAKIDLLG